MFCYKYQEQCGEEDCSAFADPGGCIDMAPDRKPKTAEGTQSILKRLVMWWANWKKERFLKRNGWEKFDGKWIHRSGLNRHPRTTEEAIEMEKTFWAAT